MQCKRASHGGALIGLDTWGTGPEASISASKTDGIQPNGELFFGHGCYLALVWGYY